MKTFTMKKIVLIQGCFDLLNSGHVRTFKRAKALGDYLIVALNTPQLIRNYKQRQPVLSYTDRKYILDSIKYIDLVVPVSSFSPLSLLKKYNVDVYMIAPEWVSSKAKEIDYMKSKGGKIVVCHDYKNVIRSSDIRKKLLQPVLETEVKKTDWNLPENRLAMEKSHPVASIISNLNRN